MLGRVVRVPQLRGHEDILTAEVRGLETLAYALRREVEGEVRVYWA